MNLNSKYLKYKSKYLNLKMKGGVVNTENLKEVIVNITTLSGSIITTHHTVDINGESSTEEFTKTIISKITNTDHFRKISETHDYKLVQGVKTIFNSMTGSVNNIDFVIEKSSIDLTLVIISPSFYPISFYNIEPADVLVFDKLKTNSLKKEKDVFKLELKNGLFELFNFIILKNYDIIQLNIRLPNEHPELPIIYKYPVLSILYEDKKYVITYYIKEPTIEHEGVRKVFDTDDISFFKNFIFNLKMKLNDSINVDHPFIFDDDSFVKNAIIDIFEMYLKM
jgi:hypothetical protein